MSNSRAANANYSIEFSDNIIRSNQPAYQSDGSSVQPFATQPHTSDGTSAAALPAANSTPFIYKDNRLMDLKASRDFLHDLTSTPVHKPSKVREEIIWDGHTGTLSFPLAVSALITSGDDSVSAIYRFPSGDASVLGIGMWHRTDAIQPLVTHFQEEFCQIRPELRTTYEPLFSPKGKAIGLTATKATAMVGNRWYEFTKHYVLSQADESEWKAWGTKRKDAPFVAIGTVRVGRYLCNPLESTFDPWYVEDA